MCVVVAKVQREAEVLGVVEVLSTKEQDEMIEQQLVQMVHLVWSQRCAQIEAVDNGAEGTGGGAQRDRVVRHGATLTTRPASCPNQRKAQMSPAPSRVIVALSVVPLAKPRKPSGALNSGPSEPAKICSPLGYFDLQRRLSLGVVEVAGPQSDTASSPPAIALCTAEIV
jgi:hypothetical protein